MLHLPLSVSPENQAYFAKNGHVYIPSLISAEELQPYRQAILDWADDFRAQQKPMAELPSVVSIGCTSAVEIPIV